MDILLKIISVILALGGFIGLLAFKRQQSVALVMFLVFFVGLGWSLYQFGFIGNSEHNSRRENEYSFNASRGAVAAKNLAKSKTSDKLVLIVPPGFKTDNPDIDGRNISFVEGVKLGFGSENVTIAVLEIPNYSDDEGLPIEDIMKAAHFDALMAQHPDAGAFMSLIGLPTNASSMAYFRTNDKRPLGLVGVPGLNPKFLVDRIKKGAINCMVIRNPELRKKKIDTSKLKATDDFNETFKLRYVLVTKDNVENYEDALRD